MFSAYEEETYLATDAEADLEYAHNVGRERFDCAWILSDRDVWYRNPFYDGPPQPHPEDYCYEDDDNDCAMYIANPPSSNTKPLDPILVDEDIAF